MTLIKSMLLGSAAGVVAVAGAQAADLPTKKAAPIAQYVKICSVGSITGWTLPGSDTCVKLSGYITAQFEGGNLSTQYINGDSPTLLNSRRRSGSAPIRGSTEPQDARYSRRQHMERRVFDAARPRRRQ